MVNGQFLANKKVPGSQLVRTRGKRRLAVHICPQLSQSDFLRYKIKFSGENKILRGIFHVVYHFPLYLMLHRGNFDYFLDSALLSQPQLLEFAHGKQQLLQV